MRTDGNNNLQVVVDDADYVIVKDDRIPLKMHNIILRPPALKIIADHYFKKYKIIIRVASASTTIENLAEHIFQDLFNAKAQHPTAHQIGFIFISYDDPDDVYGHALPILWQKENGQEHLFFLDSTEYLKNRPESSFRHFYDQLKTAIPPLRLWIIFGCRQLDYSSCYTDALVVLKDGLRVPSFKALVENKIKEVTENTTIFYAPDILLKTAQIGSYIEKSQANAREVIHLHREKACDGKPTGNVKPVTVEAFRRKYNLPVMANDKQKFFGIYSLFKAEKYVRIIVEEQEKKERRFSF